MKQKNMNMRKLSRLLHIMMTKPRPRLNNRKKRKKLARFFYQQCFWLTKIPNARDETIDKLSSDFANYNNG